MEESTSKQLGGVVLDTFDEGQCYALCEEMARKHGWQGVFFTRRDLEAELRDLGDAARGLADEVMGGEAWGEIAADLVSRGNELVHQAIEKARDARGEGGDAHPEEPGDCGGDCAETGPRFKPGDGVFFVTIRGINDARKCVGFAVISSFDPVDEVYIILGWTGRFKEDRFYRTFEEALAKAKKEND